MRWRSDPGRFLHLFEPRQGRKQHQLEFVMIDSGESSMNLDLSFTGRRAANLRLCRLVWWVAVDCYPPILLLPSSKSFLRFVEQETWSQCQLHGPAMWRSTCITRCWVLKWRRRFKQGSSISTTRCSVFTTSCFISAVSSLIRWEGIDSAGTVTPVDAEELVQRGTMPAKPTLPAHESQFVSPAWAWKSLPSWARLQAKASFWDCQTHSLGMLFMYYYVVMSIDDIIASVRCCLVTCMWE